MCGILAYYGKRDLALIDQLLIELSVRGTHATGWAFWQAGLRVVTSPVPALDFVLQQSLSALSSPVRLIAHTRYSTSDIKFNMPLQHRDTAMVLNGVISQAPRERWPLVMGYGHYKTGNDAEIALAHTVNGERGNHGGSFAVAELCKDHVLAYRNGQRPMWVGMVDGLTVVTSTADVLRRVGFTDIGPLDPGNVYDLNTDTIVGTFNPGNDLQHEPH